MVGSEYGLFCLLMFWGPNTKLGKMMVKFIWMSIPFQNSGKRSSIWSRPIGRRLLRYDIFVFIYQVIIYTLIYYSYIVFLARIWSVFCASGH